MNKFIILFLFIFILIPKLLIAQIKIVLNENDSTIVTIIAKNKWNHTEILLEAGKKYKFEVMEEIDLRDWYIKTDANGFRKWYMWIYEKLRRVPEANWFTLIGTIDESLDKYFIIGKSREFTPTVSGELVCFVNDVNGFYFNNSGLVKLKIKNQISKMEIKN
jgi:hypothetical protein